MIKIKKICQLTLVLSSLLFSNCQSMIAMRSLEVNPQGITDITGSVGIGDLSGLSPAIQIGYGILDKTEVFLHLDPYTQLLMARYQAFGHAANSWIGTVEIGGGNIQLVPSFEFEGTLKGKSDSYSEFAPVLGVYFGYKWETQSLYHVSRVYVASAFANSTHKLNWEALYNENISWISEVGYNNYAGVLSGVEISTGPKFKF